MPRINDPTLSTTHVNRTPKPVDCCVMHVSHWYMPIGCSMVPNLPLTGVQTIRIVDENWRRTAELPSTVAIATPNPSIWSIDAGNKRKVAVLSITMSSEEVTGDTSLIFDIIARGKSRPMDGVNGHHRHRKAIRVCIDINSDNGCNRGTWLERREVIIGRKGDHSMVHHPSLEICKSNNG